jgi:hypothetical protein
MSTEPRENAPTWDGKSKTFPNSSILLQKVDVQSVPGQKDKFIVTNDRPLRLVTNDPPSENSF